MKRLTSKATLAKDRAGGKVFDREATLGSNAAVGHDNLLLEHLSRQLLVLDTYRSGEVNKFTNIASSQTIRDQVYFPFR